MLLTVPWFLVPLAVFGSLKCCSSQLHSKKGVKWSYRVIQGRLEMTSKLDHLTFFEFIVHPFSWISQSMNARQFLAAVWILMRKERFNTTTLPR